MACALANRARAWAPPDPPSNRSHSSMTPSLAGMYTLGGMLPALPVAAPVSIAAACLMVASVTWPRTSMTGDVLCPVTTGGAEPLADAASGSSS